MASWVTYCRPETVASEVATGSSPLRSGQVSTGVGCGLLTEVGKGLVATLVTTSAGYVVAHAGQWHAGFGNDRTAHRRCIWRETSQGSATLLQARGR